MSDLWGTDSGLLDHYQLPVKEAWFGQPEPDADGNQSERVYLFLMGDAVDEEGEVHEDHVDRYGVGTGWEAVEEGQEVEHASKKQFNQNAGVGRLVTALAGLMAEDEDLSDTIRSTRPDPRKASAWVGLTLSQERQTFSFTSQDGETIEYSMPLPTAVEVTKAKKGRGASKAKASAKKDDSDKAEKALRRKLVKLAKDTAKDDGDHDDFVDAALDEYPEVEDFDDLHADVLDEEGEIWTEATG